MNRLANYFSIVLFSNTRAVKFKAKLTIMFYAAVNHYHNGHPKAETSKMDGVK